MRRRLIAMVVFLGMGMAMAADPKPQRMVLAGYACDVYADVTNQDKDKRLEGLKEELEIVTKAFPAKYVKALKASIVIDVHWNSKDNSWFEGQVVGNRRSGRIKLPNLQDILDAQKNKRARCTMHEMVHAVEYCCLESYKGEIEATYRQAMDRKLYRDKDGDKLYACQSAAEYFAEISMVYLVEQLPYYPHTRTELKDHDPAGFALMKKIWGEKK